MKTSISSFIWDLWKKCNLCTFYLSNIYNGRTVKTDLSSVQRYAWSNVFASVIKCKLMSFLLSSLRVQVIKVLFKFNGRMNILKDCKFDTFRLRNRVHVFGYFDIIVLFRESALWIVSRISKLMCFCWYSNDVLFFALIYLKWYLLF